MNHLVAFDAWRNAVRPADQEWRADAAFRRTEVGAVEEAAGATAGEMILGAVCTRSSIKLTDRCG